MLNISNNSITKFVMGKELNSLREVENKMSGRRMVRFLTIMSVICVGALFLPWTQNINTNGVVNTLRPDQRPQTIHSIIDGRVEKWFVREGDYVSKGDTIMFLSEIKPEYFDPGLVDRTERQLDVKKQAVESYNSKVGALEDQISTLETNRQLELEKLRNKVQQTRLKVQSDSIASVAAEINFQTADNQYKRYKQLYDQGLKSLTELENRELKMQKAMAEKISYENKLLASRNQLINAQIELSTVSNKYRTEILKAESSKFTTLSTMYDAQGSVAKLENQFMNYSIRQGMYYVTAPTDGFVTKAIQSGIGETLKQGEAIVSIMPQDPDLMVEMYVDPIDLPLLEKGQKVRLQFDGWPAIVFSGWPNASYGTYGGIVYAIDNFISDNGRYRLLVKPDPDEPAWPDALRVGGGVHAMLLLKDVPVWYELWRRINGFPPDFYKTSSEPKKTDKK